MYNIYLLIGIIFFFIISSVLTGMLMYILYKDQNTNNSNLNTLTVKSKMELNNTKSSLNNLRKEFDQYKVYQGSALNKEININKSLASQNYELQKNLDIINAKYNVATAALNEQSTLPLNVYQGIEKELHSLKDSIDNIVVGSENVETKKVIDTKPNVNIYHPLNNDGSKIAKDENSNIRIGTIGSSGSTSNTQTNNGLNNDICNCINYDGQGTRCFCKGLLPIKNNGSAITPTPDYTSNNAKSYKQFLGLNINTKDRNIANLMNAIQELLTAIQYDSCSLVDKNNFEMMKNDLKQRIIYLFENNNIGSTNWNVSNNNYKTSINSDELRGVIPVYAYEVTKNIKANMNDGDVNKNMIDKYAPIVINILNIVILISTDNSTNMVDIDKFLQLITDVYYSMCEK